MPPPLPDIPDPDDHLVQSLLASPLNSHKIHSLSGVAALYLNSLDCAALLAAKYPDGSHNPQIERHLRCASEARDSLLVIKAQNSREAAQALFSSLAVCGFRPGSTHSLRKALNAHSP